MDIQSLLSELKAERNRIDQAVSALERLASPARRGRPPKAKPMASVSGKKRRGMSAAARARIGAAKKAWWAKQEGKSGAKKTPTVSKRSTGRKPMSAVMRKRLSAMMKARWSAKKKAGAKAL